VKYLSIDIETTGLDPEKHQILEFAAVFDDLEDPLPPSALRYFHRLIRWDDYVIAPYCLNLHSELLVLIQDSPLDTITIDQLGSEFAAWLKMMGVEGGYNVAGANFAGFDGVFLKKVPRFPSWFYRIIDVGNLYWEMSTGCLPGLEDIKPYDGAHRALADAMAVVSAVREKMLSPIIPPRTFGE